MVAGPGGHRRGDSSADNSRRPLLGFAALRWDPPVVQGSDDIMNQKAHGTSSKPVQKDLRWSCDAELADQICNFNRHGAEIRGYFSQTELPKEAARAHELNFYDSNTGQLLFTKTSAKCIEMFMQESNRHGWPSFRDPDVNWKEVRVLADGEVVSRAGTHLGHNIPDYSGNRYCINLVSIAGKPQPSRLSLFACLCSSAKATEVSHSAPRVKPGHHYVRTSNRIRPPFPEHLSVCCFGAGCFWSVEKGFWRLPGVYSTAAGFCGGHDFATDPSYMYVCTGDSGHAEVVQVVWDPNVIAFADLLRFFWSCHDPTQGNAQGVDKGSPYRSGIYCSSECQALVAEASLRAFKKVLTAKGYPAITTEVRTNCPFWYAEDYHQQYLAKQPPRNHHCSAEPTGEELPPFNDWHWTPKAHTLKVDLLMPMLPEAFWQVYDGSLGSPNEPASADAASLALAVAEKMQRQQVFEEVMREQAAKHIAIVKHCVSCSFARRATELVGYVKRVCNIDVGIARDISVTGNFDLSVLYPSSKALQLVHSKKGGDGFIDTLPKVQRILMAFTEADPEGCGSDCLAHAGTYPGLRDSTTSSSLMEAPPLPLEPHLIQPPSSTVPTLLQLTFKQKQSKKQRRPKKD